MSTMKTKLLFVIDSLCIGGAEKSLTSLLNIIDYKKYEVDLLLFKEGGDFERYIPKEVSILGIPEYFRFINGNRFGLRKDIIYLFNRLKTSLNLRLNTKNNYKLHSEQVVFKCINNCLNMNLDTYDVAIAYSQGMPTYFVANKVKADKKLAWINTDYENTKYDKNIDYNSYKYIDKIVTVSNYTKNSIANLRNEYKNKVDMILDIVNPSLILKMSDEYEVNEINYNQINIMTVGRLVYAKAYNKAIYVAKLLKDDGYKFKWYAVGDGVEKENLQNLINKYDLQEYFILLGKRVNPYPYIKKSDIYVQTSLKEGFGLTVMEAKILKKPIVCTNFPTAHEIINNKVDGLIVNHDIKSIYEGIKKYLDDKKFKEGIENRLNSMEPYSSIEQVEKFYEIIEN